MFPSCASICESENAGVITLLSERMGDILTRLHMVTLRDFKTGEYEEIAGLLD